MSIFKKIHITEQESRITATPSSNTQLPFRKSKFNRPKTIFNNDSNPNKSTF